MDLLLWGLALLLHLAPPPVPTPPMAAPGTLRVLLRDTDATGIPGATLQLQLPDGTSTTLVTDARGVAVSGPLTGDHVRLLTATLPDGTVLVADALPAGAGHRLILIPGQARDVLLRRDGPWLILDPDMLFSPREPGEDAAPSPRASGLSPTTPPAVLVPSARPTPALVTPRTPAVAHPFPALLGLLGLLALLGLGWWMGRRASR